MGLRKLNALILIAASLAAVSCKDDDDTETAPSLEGTLAFSIPEFISPGTTYTMTPKGLSHPGSSDGSDSGIGYYWKVSPAMDAYDTTRLENGCKPESEELSDGSFTFTFDDALETYTIYCYAYANGYAISSAYSYTTTVKGGPQGSITGTGISDEDEDAVTAADGQTYHYVRIGGLDWIRRNLADKSSGTAFRKAEVMYDVFGMYYNHEEAETACGSIGDEWRLPTAAEWDSLWKDDEKTDGVYYIKDMLANASFNGELMWSYWPEMGDITNSSRLALIPTGMANLGDKDEEADGSVANGLMLRYPAASFTGVYNYATFWTADKVEDSGTLAYYRYIYAEQPVMQTGKGSRKYFGAAVRCVRDAVQ